MRNHDRRTRRQVLKGAIGGAAGTGAVLATRGREVELGNGADITATLASPITVRVEE